MFKIAYKDLRLFFSDKRAVLLTFIVPITLITLFALAFGGGTGNEVKPISLVIVDLDNTDTSKSIIKQLDATKAFGIQVLDIETAQNKVKEGKESAALILRKGFKDSIILGDPVPLEIICDKAKNMEVGILYQALTSNLMQLIGSKALLKKQLDKVSKNLTFLDTQQLRSIRTEIKKGMEATEKQQGGNGVLNFKTTAIVAAPETDPGLIQAVAGTAVMMLLFSVAGIGAGLLDERDGGTLKRLLYSPVKPVYILFGKMIATNVIAMLQLLIMFSYASVVFGLKLSTNIPALLVMIVVTAFAASSFGVLLASFAKSRQQVQGISTLIVLTMSAIGGSMIPLFVMPLWMQKLAVVSLNYWSIQGFYDIFWRHLAFTDPTFMGRVLVLSLIGIGLNTCAAFLFRKNILTIA